MVRSIARLFGRGKEEAECQHVRGLSSDFLDSELDEASMSRVSDHLGGCRFCRVFFDTLRATLNLLRSTPKSTAPESLRGRVLDSARKADE
jgi:predicted anti-sigma-YlaC factor YlaD